MPHYTRRLDSIVTSEVQIGGSEWSSCADFADRPLGPGQEPELGSHVVTSRRFYLHHGIYVGGGFFIHYAGFTRGLHRGPVEEVSIERFSGGRSVWVRFDGPPNVDRLDVVQRARSRLGENSYRLFNNNCSHFCKWCLNGNKCNAGSATGYLPAVSHLVLLLLFIARYLARSGTFKSLIVSLLFFRRTPRVDGARA
jgi:hypothetical protein